MLPSIVGTLKRRRLQERVRDTLSGLLGVIRPLRTFGGAGVGSMTYDTIVTWWIRARGEVCNEFGVVRSSMFALGETLLRIEYAGIATQGVCE